MIDRFIREHRLSEEFVATAESYYIPLANRIALHQKEAKACFYVGINGCQGSGKSTLGDFLGTYLQQTYQFNVVILSLDDFYFDQQQRTLLANSVHPLFATRGVPGTHNTELMKEVLIALSTKGETLALPKFNKATDNPFPVEEWSVIKPPVDVVILEGWCWGIEAQLSEELLSPVNTLEANDDSDGTWRNYVNQQLAKHYQPLYNLMDYWVMLQAPNFSNVYNWRLEQEQKLAKKMQDTQNSNLMDAAQIKRFIQFYQRLTEHGLKTLPAKCDEVFELNATRKIMKHILRAQ